MNYSLYILYVVSALLPGIIWLFFYLLKDKHPEPQRDIIKVFFLGVIVASIVYLLTSLVFSNVSIFYGGLSPQNVWVVAFKYFLLVALVEELSKYLIVRRFVMFSPDVDEPIDIMLYLVISALGFATMENILLIFTVILPTTTTEIVYFSLLRFVGATFLHTLASGTLGFFLAISIYASKNKKAIFFFGLVLATAMHGFYDFAIIEFTGTKQILTQAYILAGLAVFTTWGFIRLRNIKNARKIVK